MNDEVKFIAVCHFGSYELIPMAWCEDEAGWFRPFRSIERDGKGEIVSESVRDSGLRLRYE